MHTPGVSVSRSALESYFRIAFGEKNDTFILSSYIAPYSYKKV